MANKKKANPLNLSKSRGRTARGLTGVNENGKNAYKKSLSSTKGHYRVEFTRVYEGLSEKDVELRKVYGTDLVSQYAGIPTDMLTLKMKKSTGEQTLTARDEVYYIRVGKDIYGKLSIRTQRLLKGNMLVFVLQVKKNAIKSPQKAFSRNVGFKSKTKSQKQQTSRNSYYNRERGKY